MNVRFRSITAPMAITATAALALAGCSDTAETATPESGAPTLHVVTSVYPVEYLAQQIGGDLVEVENLTPAGAEPHDLELSPAKVAALSSADVAITLSGFQPAVDDAVATNPPATVVDLATAVQLVTREEEDHDHEADEAQSGHDHEAESAESGHGEAHEDAHGAETTESGHDHEAEESGHGHDHDHGGLDPHFWLDPTRMGQAATVIGQAFAKADPDNAQTYTRNAGSLTKAMNDLATTLVTGTKQCARTTFVTTHEAFGYLADRTGLTQVGISGIDPETTPSPARLHEIGDLVKKDGVTTIFTETALNSEVAQTLADELGVSTAVLDPVETQANPTQDYMAVMAANITALRKALDCR